MEEKMAKKKTLPPLKVQSFVTLLNDDDKGRIKGGTGDSTGDSLDTNCYVCGTDESFPFWQCGGLCSLPVWACNPE
jgi:hypothetical protein